MKEIPYFFLTKLSLTIRLVFSPVSIIISYSTWSLNIYYKSYLILCLLFSIPDFKTIFLSTYLLVSLTISYFGTTFVPYVFKAVIISYFIYYLK